MKATASQYLQSAHAMKRSSSASSLFSSSASSSDSEADYSRAVNRDVNVLSQHMAALDTNSDDDGKSAAAASLSSQATIADVPAAAKSKANPEDEIAALMTTGFNKDQAMARAKYLYAKLWRTQGVLTEFERAIAMFHDAAYTLSAKHDEIEVERRGEVAEFKALMALLGTSNEATAELE